MQKSGCMILFKIIEFPFLVFRQLTIPLIDEDIYTKDTVVMCSLFMPLLSGAVLYWPHWYFVFVYLTIGVILMGIMMKYLKKEEPPTNIIICTVYFISNIDNICNII